MTLSFGTETDFTPAANAASPQTQSITVASGVEALVVVVTIYDISATDGVVSGVTWNTTENFSVGVGPEYDATSDGHLSVWYLNAPTATTADISVAFGGTVTDFMASVVEVNSTTAGNYLFVDSTDVFATGNGSPSTVWDTTVADTAIFGVMLSDQAQAKITMDAGPTEMYTTDVGSDHVGAARRIVTASGTQTISWTDTDNDEDWCATGVAFYEGAPPTGKPAWMMHYKKMRTQ